MKASEVFSKNNQYKLEFSRGNTANDRLDLNKVSFTANDRLDLNKLLFSNVELDEDARELTALIKKVRDSLLALLERPRISLSLSHEWPMIRGKRRKSDAFSHVTGKKTLYQRPRENVMGRSLESKSQMSNSLSNGCDYYNSKQFLPSPVSFPRASFISEQIISASPKIRRLSSKATSSQKRAIVQKLNSENIKMEKYYSWSSTDEDIFQLDTVLD